MAATTTAALKGPDFETVFREVLTLGSDLAALVGTKIYALTIPTGQELPCVTYQRLSGIPANTLEGHSGLEHITMQVDAWGRNYAEAKSVAKAVRLALATQQSDLASGGVFGARLDSDSDYYEDETNYYRISMEYSCWFLEGED